MKGQEAKKAPEMTRIFAGTNSGMPANENSYGGTKQVEVRNAYTTRSKKATIIRWSPPKQLSVKQFKPE